MAQNKLAWTFAITTIALFMTALDNLVVVTALPAIQQDLGASLSELEWTVNAYTLTFAVLLLTGAALGDRFGRKRMFIVGLAIFTAASALAALSSDTNILIVARALQGLGAAIVTPLTLTILSGATPPEKRGAILGAWGGIAGLAVAIGPIVGGAIVDGDRLAVDLLARTSRSASSRFPSRGSQLNESRRARRQARHARPRPRRRSSVSSASSRASSARTPRVGDRHEVLGFWSHRHRAGRHVRLVGGAYLEGADAAAPLLPEPRLLGGERGFGRDVLRHVRLDLPADAVLADGAGLLTRSSAGVRMLAWTGRDDDRRARSQDACRTASGAGR